MEPAGSADVARRNAERALAVFEELGDEAGLSHAWRLLVNVFLCWGRAADMERAARRALEHARRAGDELSEARSRGWICAALESGPTPLPDVRAELEQALEWAREKGMLLAEAFRLQGLMEVQAATGDFAAARVAEARRRAIGDELGLGYLPFTDWSLGHIAVLAGNPSEAEARLRAAHDGLARRGERSALSTVAAELADVIYANGRHDEAWELTRESEEKAARDDAVSQIIWRRVRAKVLARRGELDEAEALAGEAVALASGTDCPEWRADAHMDLAEVLLVAGRPEEAISHVHKAFDLYARKGNIVSTRRAANRLNELGVPARTP
jgi:tetratricopeptide (TPR) repeat protein